ncbi:MAG TPA: phosphatase PAP2 family protein [Candidatus Paceibacterota bacterium]
MDTLAIIVAKYLIVVPAAAVGIYFFSRPRSEWGHMLLFLVPSGLLALLLAWIGGHLYTDPRPFVVGNFIPLVPHAPDNGFPSDHMLLASWLAMVASIKDKRFGAVLWVVALVIGAARVYVGVHHAIDIVGSAIIACVAVIAWRAVFRRLV